MVDQKSGKIPLSTRHGSAKAFMKEVVHVKNKPKPKVENKYVPSTQISNAFKNFSNNNFSQKLQAATEGSNRMSTKSKNSKSGMENTRNSKKNRNLHQMSMQQLPANNIINDISGYATKSRKNILDNDSKVIGTQEILKDLHTEVDEYFYDDEILNSIDKESTTLTVSKFDRTECKNISKLNKCKSYNDKMDISCSVSAMDKSDIGSKCSYKQPIKSPKIVPDWKDNTNNNYNTNDTRISIKSNKSKAAVPGSKLVLETQSSKYKTKRMASENRSPRIPMSKGKSTSNGAPKPAHSQTVD